MMSSYDRIPAVTFSYEEISKTPNSCSDTSRKRVKDPSPVLDVNGNHTQLKNLNKEQQLDPHHQADFLGEYRDYKPNFPIMWRTRYRVITCLIAGVVFGMAMEKGRVFEPDIIRKQMIPSWTFFQRNIMLKMFFSAMTTSLVCLSVLSLLPSTTHLFNAARRNYTCRFRTKSVLSSCIGGWLLGAGMAIAGSCPGAVLTQVGAGVKNSEYTLFGCLLAALVYGLLEKEIATLMRSKPQIQECSYDKQIQTSFHKVALPLSCLVGIFVLSVEYIVPWNTELGQQNSEGAGFLAMYGWPPLIAGSMVGLLQIPIVIGVEETIGGSSGYCTLVSQLFSKETLKSTSPYLLSYKYGLDNWWQVIYIGGAVGGAYISSTMSSTFGTATGLSAMSCFIGGFTMVFGARLAGGCTSGNGLSGVGTLTIFAFYSVPAMFVGGIATGTLMSLLGLY